MKNEAKNICYLIDSENISDVWVELINALRPTDSIIVFYTGKSSHLSCEKVRRLMESDRKSISWISCYNDSSNALDFQLVTELGSMAAKGLVDEYVIVSNDKGFDAVVKYWKREGKLIRRIKDGECVRQAKLIEQAEANQERKAPDPKPIHAKTSAEKVAAVKKVKAAQVNLSEVGVGTNINSVLSVLCKSIPIEQSPLLNNALILLFTPTQGTKIYNKLKRHPDYCNTLSQRLLPDKNKRIENYIGLILKVNKINTENAYEISKILSKRPKYDGNKIRKDFVAVFGEEDGIKIFNLIKRHNSIINKI